MSILLTTVFVYALGLLLTAVGSRLAGRCTTWCCALLGLPMWVVGGTVAPFCLALPQLMLAFLAAGMSVTALAVGTALAGAVANLGLALAVCLLNRRRYATADRDEFCRKCLLLLAACGVLAVFVRDGELSYTGTGLLMLLFVLFILMSIAFQHNFTYGETIEAVSTSEPCPARACHEGVRLHGHTMAFPVMSVRNSLKNLAGVLAGWRCWRAELWRWCTAPPRWQTSPARYRPCGRRRSSALDSAACLCWPKPWNTPWGRSGSGSLCGAATTRRTRCPSSC